MITRANPCPGPQKQKTESRISRRITRKERESQGREKQFTFSGSDASSDPRKAMVAASKVQTSFLPSFLPSPPLAALQAWSTIMTGKKPQNERNRPTRKHNNSHKTQKKLLPLRCISSNPKPQIHHSFPTTTPPLPTFFEVLLLLPLQFLSIPAASSSLLPWPLFLADHVRFRSRPHKLRTSDSVSRLHESCEERSSLLRALRLFVVSLRCVAPKPNWTEFTNACYFIQINHPCKTFSLDGTTNT